MVGQQQRTSTAESLKKLQHAEQKVISALTHATEAIRTLSKTEAPNSSLFSTQAKSFLSELREAQEVIHGQISTLRTDLPFENVTMRRLVETDLAVQRTAHVHRSLVQTLKMMGEPVAGFTSASLPAAASPNNMPSPIANTPVGLLGGGVAPSPPAGSVAINIAVPSPDAAVGASLLSQGLNGGVADGDDNDDGVSMDVQ